MMKDKLLLLIFFFATNCFSQFSKTHYIPPISNSADQAVQGQFLYVSSPSLTPVNFKIQPIGGTIINGSASRDNPYTLNIGFGAATPLMISRNQVGGIFSNKGYIVEAENLVYVTVRLTTTPANYQAGSLVSKGLAALGTQFRIGAFTNLNVQQTDNNHYTFASILATENNTVVQFADIDSGVTLVNNFGGSSPSPITLNRGESYVIAVEGPNFANRDGLIGMLISSDKPIAVNCGSVAGTNGDANNLDLGIDQIVSAERTGKEYIFIRGNGENSVERPLIIAHEDGTEVFINGSNIPIDILNAGDYIAINGSAFSAEGTLFVNTSKDVFAYQGLGGTNAQANQNMHFVPPLSCETPRIINNIPLINQIGSDSNYTGTVCVVTETDADLEFIINGVTYDLENLPPLIFVNGPISVNGNPNYETYTFNGLSGNISVFSTKQVYVSYFGSSGAATYGGFYSGFTFNPEISFEKLDAFLPTCLPNISLAVSELAAFDQYQWYLNDVAITDANDRIYMPSVPGFYSVVGTITACNIELPSDKIPVSSCPEDLDLDGINDNVDLDNDNDGITNCEESLGNVPINSSNPNAGTIAVGDYTNAFSGNTSISGPAAGAAFTGDANGNFISAVPAGFTNSITQRFDFDAPISLTIGYVDSANQQDLPNANGDFIVEVSTDKTLTVLNPDGQLLIDTNYDGIYESGITEHSSFQIRFRLNSVVPLQPGTGTFKIQGYLIDSISYTHKNLSEDQISRATFALYANCVPRDWDNDGTIDQLDLDSDNDGVPDSFETAADTDLDGTANYLDLDTDNDGIYDLVESASNASDADNNGVVDGSPASFGANGLAASIEDGTNSGVLNYTIADTDADGIFNFISLDSDGDDCFDVVEAGFADGNTDGQLGDAPAVTDGNGIVTNGAGYTTPNSEYLLAGPIIINTPIADTAVCEFEDASFTIDSNADSFQWQMSTDGVNFVAITDGAEFSGSQTPALTVTAPDNTDDGNQFRVLLDRSGNACGLASAAATLTLLDLPIVNPVTTLIQCDNDKDGFTDFNLTESENQVSANAANETFSYFTTLAGADNNDSDFSIADPMAYNNSNGNIVWIRVLNASGSCSSVAQLNLSVSTSQLPPGFLIAFETCDDFLSGISTDTDGISTFDFSDADNQIAALLPNTSDYTIHYYRNEADALAENNLQGNSLEITGISNYRNTASPGLQLIWVRIENNTNNGCYALGPLVSLRVNPLPDIRIHNALQICTGIQNQVVVLNARLLSGNISDYSYQWSYEGTILADANAYTYDAINEGVYTVLVTNIATGCAVTGTTTLVASQQAVIEDIIVTDLADNKTIEVIVSGLGDYEFALDYIEGPYQAANVFQQVTSGFHTIYVRDLKGCDTASQFVPVVGAQKFFTPNGDGYNDTWRINGINTTFNFNSTVYIFDRYGRLLKQLPPGDLQGWDGTFNNQPLPADDYWYTLDLEDGRTSKGHFSLKR